ncbi:nucleotidyl cyclase domain-containing protein [Pseudomonas oryziphila]|uniref:hypothetical protein n=1 Tax=Pseudomonas oryziphila TaxID=2894079 RepID=UPI0016737D67|nr:hypothetical protein [Pseudomonas oryziphila]
MPLSLPTLMLVAVAQRICARFAGLPMLEPGRLGVSIGSVSRRASECDLSRPLSMADHALYATKQQGRSRVLQYAGA